MIKTFIMWILSIFSPFNADEIEIKRDQTRDPYMCCSASLITHLKEKIVL